jgi:diguanylate cyclase (GGDEF)-like protein
MRTPSKLTPSHKKRIKTLSSVARSQPAQQKIRTQRVEKLEKSLRQANEALRLMRTLAYVDDLCQIHNRRAFNEELKKVTDLAWRYGHVATVIIFDVDRFKEVNDEYGHAIGDLALIAVAHAIRSSIRASDFAARIGGDEFAVILHQICELDAQAKADEICALIAGTQINTGAGVISVTASAGVSNIARADIGQPLVEADHAMLRQKRAARTIYGYS